MYGLKRDKEFMDKVIYEKGGKYYCSKRCSIEYPTWYADKGLAVFGEELSFFGVCIIICEDKYCVSTIPTLVRTNPILITQIDRDGVLYTKLEFGPNDPIISNDTVVKETLLSYDYINNFFLRSKVPWFIKYEDFSKITNLLVKYGGSNAGDSPIANEAMVSFTTRDAKDLNKFYRQTSMTGPYAFMDLMNVFYSVKSIADRMAGGYFDDATVASLLSPPQDKTAIEKHLTE